MIFILLIIASYFYITIKLRGNAPDREALKPKQAILFVIAMTLVYVTKGSPVDLMAHIMFTFHMFQMAFLYLVYTTYPNCLHSKLGVERTYSQ